jgi:hypothetical protein
MSDDSKSKEEAAKSKSTASESASPSPLASTIQANPNQNASNNAKNPRKQNCNPFLRLARIIRKHRREFPKWTDIAIVVLTGGIVFLALMQWYEMHDAGKQTDKIIAADERLATAMEGSVKEAGDALQATVDQFHMELRAWVTPVAVQPFILAPNVETKFAVRIANVGKTPAKKVHTIIQGSVLSRAEKFIPTYDPMRERAPSRSLIAPNGSLDMVTNEFRRDAATTEGIRTGAVIVRFFGKVEYEDIFGKQRISTFCYLVLPDLKSSTPCETYNDAN